MSASPARVVLTCVCSQLLAECCRGFRSNPLSSLLDFLAYFLFLRRATLSPSQWLQSRRRNDETSCRLIDGTELNSCFFSFSFILPTRIPHALSTRQISLGGGPVDLTRRLINGLKEIFPQKIRWGSSI